MVYSIQYSEKCADDNYEYRLVTLPRELSKTIPSGRLLTESEWRGLGVQQSRGWVHYMIYKPNYPSILIFRRPIGTDPVTGKVPCDWRDPQGNPHVSSPVSPSKNDEKKST